MIKQLFYLNIPAELTRSGRPDRQVAIKTLRLQNGKWHSTDFVDLDTHLTIEVRDWLHVWELAKERSERLWESAHNVRQMYELKVSEDHQAQLRSLS